MTNEVLQTIKSRRTVRAYRPDAVPEELLQAVLEAGTYAPTGRGRQSPTIIAVTSEGYRQKISELNAAVLGSDSDPYYGAPVIILVLADGTANTFVEDGSCVLENMMLAAASLGLGSVWVHREREIFDSEEGKALLQAWGLPETLRDIPNKGILGTQPRRRIVDPVPQWDRQITQLAVDIADIGHREALVLLPFIQLLPQQVQRVIVGPRLAAVHTVTVRTVSVRRIPAGRRIPVVDVDRPHTGYLHLTGCQRQRHGQGQQRRCKKPDQFLPIVTHGSPPSCVLLSLIPVRG